MSGGKYPTIEDWDYRGGWDDEFDMFVAEIKGGAYMDDEIVDALDDTSHRFGQVENVLYYRANNTSAQRELVESLDIAWNPAKFPMLLVLEKDPSDVEPGDRAIQFGLGELTRGNQVRKVTEVLIEASRDEDFMKTLTWEKRKERISAMLPIFKDGASLAISVVGLGL